MSKSTVEARAEVDNVKDLTKGIELGSADGRSCVSVDSCELDLVRLKVDEYGDVSGAWLDFDAVVKLRDTLHEWIIRTNIKGRP